MVDLLNPGLLDPRPALECKVLRGQHSRQILFKFQKIPENSRKFQKFQKFQNRLKKLQSHSNNFRTFQTFYTHATIQETA